MTRALVGVLAIAACQSVTPTANGVFPANGFEGRSVRVEITGDATAWDSTAAVSFGTGVTVSNVTAASPTDLFADVAIDPTAPTGLHDVTVSQDGTTYTLAKAFEIDIPATATVTGTLAQGSVITLSITNVDTDTPFDATAISDAFGNISYPDLAIDAPAGVGYTIQAASPFSITAILLVDVDAGSGGPLAVESGPPGSDVVTTAVGSIAIAPRAATPLTAAAPVTGTYGDPLSTQLYRYNATAPDFLDLSIATNANAAEPALAILPTGHFADADGYLYFTYNAFEATGSGGYAIVWDTSGASSYSYTLAESEVTLSNSIDLAMLGSDDASALAAQLPAYGSNGDGSLDDYGSLWLQFTITDPGTLEIVTRGDAYMNLALYASAGDAESGTPLDHAFEALQDTVTPGTYYLELTEDHGDSFADDYTLAMFEQ